MYGTATASAVSFNGQHQFVRRRTSRSSCVLVKRFDQRDHIDKLHDRLTVNFNNAIANDKTGLICGEDGWMSPTV